MAPKRQDDAPSAEMVTTEPEQKPEGRESNAALMKKASSVKSMLESYRPQIAQALPRHINPDRMLRIALTEGQRPEILACHTGSLIAAVLQSAQLGLEIGGGLGQAYLVPFWNKDTKRKEVQLMPGYRGLVHLVRATGKVEGFEARVVYAKDTFDLAYGLVNQLIHRPFIPRPDKGEKDDAGHVIGAYSIARFKGGEPQFDWMTYAQLESIRGRSKAKSGPWVTDTDEMYRKTVAKRLAKWLPMSVELATALELDNKHEAGEAQTLPEIRVTSMAKMDAIEGATDSVLEEFGQDGKQSAAKLLAAASGLDEGRFADRMAQLEEADSLSELETLHGALMADVAGNAQQMDAASAQMTKVAARLAKAAK